MTEISQLPPTSGLVTGDVTLLVRLVGGTATAYQLPLAALAAAATPTIAVTVTPLAAGDAPTVTPGGTAEAPTFQIGIPAGAQGAAGAPGSSTSITNAAAATTMSTTDTVGISTGGADHQITLANLLTAGGTSVTALSAAATAAAGDEVVTLQSGATVLQTVSGLWSYFGAQVPGLRTPVVLLTGNTVLDGSTHNGCLLICENPLTISPAASFSSLSSGFNCTIINVSGAAVTFASGITTSGGTTLPSGQAAEIDAFTYSGGNIIFANIGGSTTASSGLTVGVASNTVTTGGTISVIGTVNPSGTAVQVALGTSASTPPTTGWASATVSGTAFTASITALTAGTFYVWAQETGNTSIQAVSGAVIVSTSASVAFTSPPTTGTVGTALSLAGTVSPSGTAVQVALGTSASTPPTTGWVSATVSGTGWTAALTPSTAGTFYLWAEQTSTTAVQAVSAAVTIVSSSGNATILTQSGGTTWSNSTVTIPSTMSISGVTASPQGLTMPITPAQASGATVTGYWTTSVPTTEPTTGELTTSNGAIAPIFYQTNVAAYLGAPSTVGVWYLSIWIDNNGSNNGHVVLTPITWTS